MSARDELSENPVGLTLLDADDVCAAALDANEMREWATDNRTGQRMAFTWCEGPATGWEPDTDDARYAAARKRAILRRRERAAWEASR